MGHEDEVQTHWQKVLAYCQTSPTPNGRFHTADVTEAVMPASEKADRNVARSTIYSSIKRRSVGESSDPYFYWIGDGKFRLATPDERIKAKELAKPKGKASP